MSKESGNKGKVFIIIGGTGTGKSTFTEFNFVKNNSPVLLYDVNNEYPDIEPDKTGKKRRCKVSPMDCTIEQFIRMAKFRENTNIIYEEATGFFNFRASSEMMQRIVAKRHGNNNYIFIFHSVKQVPKDLFEMVDYIILFKTKDIIADVEKKRPELIEPFKDLKKDRNKYAKKIIKL